MMKLKIFVTHRIPCCARCTNVFNDLKVSCQRYIHRSRFSHSLDLWSRYFFFNEFSLSSLDMNVAMDQIRLYRACQDPSRAPLTTALNRTIQTNILVSGRHNAKHKTQTKLKQNTRAIFCDFLLFFRIAERNHICSRDKNSILFILYKLPQIIILIYRLAILIYFLRWKCKYENSSRRNDSGYHLAIHKIDSLERLTVVKFHCWRIAFEIIELHIYHMAICRSHDHLL